MVYNPSAAVAVVWRGRSSRLHGVHYMLLYKKIVFNTCGICKESCTSVLYLLQPSGQEAFQTLKKLYDSFQLSLGLQGPIFQRRPIPLYCPAEQTQEGEVWELCIQHPQINQNKSHRTVQQRRSNYFAQLSTPVLTQNM